MLRSGAQGCLSAGWVARWTCFAVLLEFFIFSMGLASSTKSFHGDQIDSVGEGLQDLTEMQVHDIPKCFNSPASLESQSSKEILARASFVPALNGLQILVRKISSAIRVVCRIQLGIAGRDAIVRPASDVARARGSRRLMLKRASGTTFSRSRRYVCPPVQQHLKERLMIEETATLAGEQTQQVALGPPAPKGLVQNEKQDWNQDYAEPDVHPPSSN